MSSISVYNRYTPPAWATRPVSAPTRRPQRAQPRQQPQREPPKPAGAAPADHGRPRRPSGHAGLVPAGLDSGDLFLAAMLLFLYSESHDEDFLIILIVVGLSIFQKK